MTAMARLWLVVPLVPVAAFALTLVERARFAPLDRLRHAVHRRHMEARLARGNDLYFEELRALRAYPPEAPPPPRPFARAFAVNLVHLTATAAVAAFMLYWLSRV
jgi:hypothetical protein